MKILELIYKIVQLYKPKYYNRITMIIVIGGLSLVGTPIWEAILEAILEKNLDILLPNSNEPYIGIALILIGIFFNLCMKYLDSLKNNDIPKYRTRRHARKYAIKIIDENKNIFNNYGPNSENANVNPINATDIWNEYASQIIIPNNDKLVSFLEKNKKLLNQDEKEIFATFKLHVRDFKNNKTSNNLNTNPIFFPPQLNDILR